MCGTSGCGTSPRCRATSWRRSVISSTSIRNWSRRRAPTCAAGRTVSPPKTRSGHRAAGRAERIAEGEPAGHPAPRRGGQAPAQQVAAADPPAAYGELRRAVDALLGTNSFLDRLEATGILSAEQATRLGLVGPVARSTGTPRRASDDPAGRSGPRARAGRAEDVPYTGVAARHPMPSAPRVGSPVSGRPGARRRASISVSAASRPSSGSVSSWRRTVGSFAAASRTASRRSADSA
jgi:hypothetical protein